MHDNAAIARIFTEMADVCEIRGDNVFKIRAFRNAAQAIETLPHDVETIARAPDAERRLKEIQGIGSGIASKIIEIVTTGALDEHKKLLAEFPPSLLELLELDGVGPKKVRLFHDDLGVKSIADLDKAIKEGRVAKLPKMGAKTIDNLARAVESLKGREKRFLLSWAEKAVERVTEMLRAIPGVKRVEAAGSFRRRRETVGDLDVLCCCADPALVHERMAKTGTVLASGGTKTSVRLSSGIQCDVRVVPEESFGAALHYFTGSKTHNITIRGMALRRCLTINEYGVFKLNEDGSTGERVGGATEEEVFGAVGLPWIPPELRENRGEFEAAAEGRLPRLIDPRDLRGDVHMHTSETDGSATIEEMARAGIERGHGYIAITDHSKALAMTKGMDEARLAAHRDRIRAIARPLEPHFRLLAGVEVDILQDGALDLADDALAALDVVVGSVHSRFDLSRDEMTARVVRAIRSNRIDIVGHPTGRKLLQRDAYAIDMEAVMRAAKEHGVALEVSAYPDRLDLSDTHVRLAKEMGVKLVIDTDAHAPNHIFLQRYGVDTARRGWLEKSEVLNTMECDDFLRALHAGHR